MTYNCAGKRVQKLTSTQTRNFFYDYDKVLQEYDQSDTTTKRISHHGAVRRAAECLHQWQHLY